MATTLIPATDGFQLSATTYEPEGPSLGQVVLNSAMGPAYQYADKDSKRPLNVVL